MENKRHYTQAIWNSVPVASSTYNSLSGNLKADVVVVGAGITGLSTAFNLMKNGKKVVVIESGEVGMGTTGSSTGNLYVPTGKFQTILSKHGHKGLEAVISSRSAAFAFIEERINEFGIDCGFMKVPWYYFTNDLQHTSEIEKEFEAMSAGGLNVKNAHPMPFYFPVKSMAFVDGQAQFNPLQYVKGLAAAIAGPDCLIFEHTTVTDIKDGSPCRVETTGGTVEAEYVVQATHTPKGIYAVHAAMEVYREYAVAARLKQKWPQEAIYWMREGNSKYSIRSYTTDTGSYLIVLDESQKTGHREDTRASFSKLEAYVRSVFEVDEVSWFWAAQNYSPADELPYIGTSPLQHHVFIATGFSADGLIYGTAAALIIADLILGRQNLWAKTFDPKRFTPVASFEKILKENIGVATHLVKDYLKGAEKELTGLRPGESRIVDYQGKKAAAYKDEAGQVHLVSAKCTHLGCIVHWNNAEKSWDCPCHGSRFSVDGDVLEGPAFKGLQHYYEPPV